MLVVMRGTKQNKAEQEGRGACRPVPVWPGRTSLSGNKGRGLQEGRKVAVWQPTQEHSRQRHRLVHLRRSHTGVSPPKMHITLGRAVSSSEKGL